VSLNVQARASLETFLDEIVDPVAFRVFARSRFAYGHEPAAPEDAPAAFPVTVLQPALAAAAAVPFPPQAATSNPAVTTRTGTDAMRTIVA
jgi:hypothetical protein